MNKSKFIEIFTKSRILIPVFITSLLLGVFLFYYIPIVMEDGIIKNIIKHSKESVERLQIQREYYTKAVVGDVKKYAPKLTFDYEHSGVDGKLPFPTTTIHDLSAMYSKRSDVKFELYSKYPFLNRKDRVLTTFQKEAIEMVQKSEEGMFYKKDIIDGVAVLRVAIADYMVLPICVSCHNTHKLKDWDFKWKLGDKRGILEIITPMDEAVKEMNYSRNKIVLAALSLMFILFIYYSYILLKREKELNDKNEELNEDFDNLFKDFDKNVIASKTDLKGIITYASKKFCEASEYTQLELLGKNHNIIRDKDMPKEIFKDMWNTIEKNKIWSGEIKNRKKSGDYYWVTSIISPFYNYEGIKIGYSAIREDITDKKKIEELNTNLEIKIKQEVDKNREKDKQMIQQGRLAQMGEMISMIAHQWRQPLSAISSTSSGLNLKAKLGKSDKEMILKLTDDINRYSEHLSTTINDFRDFYKSNKELKAISYEEILKDVLNIVRISIENKNIEIIEDYGCNKVFDTYPNEIKQVVLNLIKNSEDALLYNYIDNPFIKIITFTVNDSYILEISDNGLGIPENIIDKIFDPYFSTKTAKDGTGLGLYMSKTIIETNCKGEISVHNNKDGAVFRIILS